MPILPDGGGGLLPGGYRRRKGVKKITRKLMGVTRLRDTPISTFMSKLDRDIRDPVFLSDG